MFALLALRIVNAELALRTDFGLLNRTLLNQLAAS
jgi:hypothetical protein